MTRWAFWRRQAAPSAQPVAPAQPPGRVDPGWAEVPLAVLSWCLPGSAVVVGVLGQIALAVVLLALAVGIWLRLWRGRRRRQS